MRETAVQAIDRNFPATRLDSSAVLTKNIPDMQKLIKSLSAEQPILIAGPTASGKSAIALEIAASKGGVIVNADALQVFANWRLLTARPADAELSAAPHHLYGHIAGDISYSVGQWLRDITPLLAGPERLIIVGGTGLYFSALSEGLADIPEIPAEIRARANLLIREDGVGSMLAGLDGATAGRIDTANPMRVQRAWEVLQATGRGLADWQDNTPPPALPLAKTQTILLQADRDWLGARIEQRFDAMLAGGGLEEARKNLNSWDPAVPSAKAIGATQLIAHLRGTTTLAAARESALIATRQYAKRQRTWFRSRMKKWTILDLP